MNFERNYWNLSGPNISIIRYSKLKIDDIYKGNMSTDKHKNKTHDIRTYKLWIILRFTSIEMRLIYKCEK